MGGREDPCITLVVYSLIGFQMCPLSYGGQNEPLWPTECKRSTFERKHTDGTSTWERLAQAKVLCFQSFNIETNVDNFQKATYDNVSGEWESNQCRGDPNQRDPRKRTRRSCRDIWWEKRFWDVDCCIPYSINTLFRFNHLINFQLRSPKGRGTYQRLHYSKPQTIIQGLCWNGTWRMNTDELQ